MNALLGSVLVLVGVGAAAPAPGGAETCDLSKAVRAYFADLVPGVAIETTTRLTRPGHQTVTTTRAGAATQGGATIVRVASRVEARPLGAPDPAAATRLDEARHTYALAVLPAGKAVTVVRRSVPARRGAATREERLEPAAAVSLLPGLEAYCLTDRRADREEAVATPAGRFTARVYRVGTARFWVAPGVPFGGLVRARDEGPSGSPWTVEMMVTRIETGRPGLKGAGR
jgi:hypothetical protein